MCNSKILLLYSGVVGLILMGNWDCNKSFRFLNKGQGALDFYPCFFGFWIVKLVGLNGAYCIVDESLVIEVIYDK